jgi:hypothetical protein
MAHATRNVSTVTCVREAVVYVPLNTILTLAGREPTVPLSCQGSAWRRLRPQALSLRAEVPGVRTRPGLGSAGRSGPQDRPAPRWPAGGARVIRLPRPARSRGRGCRAKTKGIPVLLREPFHNSLPKMSARQARTGLPRALNSSEVPCSTKARAG